MNKFTLALSALLMLAMVVVLAPGIFALNRGHILRNIALWLAVFLGLAVIYRSVGPGSPHPLFSLPAVMEHDALPRVPAENTAAPSADNATPAGKPGDGDKGFTPPSE